MNFLKYLAICTIFFTMNVFATVYEDAEAQTIMDWKILDNNPIGATITNIFDVTRNSRVVDLNGSGRLNSYLLGGKSGTDTWNNNSEKTIKWSMNINEKYKIYIYLETKKGTRYLYYTHGTKDKGLIENKYIHYGLGKSSMNGTWQTFTRNLEADLQKYENGNSIIAVNGFKIQGSVKLDDIELINLDDRVAPVVTLNGDASLMLFQNNFYEELGATANDETDGAIDVVISGEVDTTVAGEYIITYTATDSSENSASLTRVLTVQEVSQENPQLILNEYSAVLPVNYLKNKGIDSYFQRVRGNGGAWIELVSTGNHVDIRGALLTISQSGSDEFQAKIPYEPHLGHIRRGTIITISLEPTDMSYAPFSATMGDWTLNINVNDLLEKVGTFELSSREVSASLINEAAGEYLLLPSGEEHAAVSIDAREIFKLKSNPQNGILPSSASYGDDNNGKTFSTFGSANQWGVNGEYRQELHILRANPELNELGGVALSTIPALDDITDAESILYIPQNNTLWIADDDAHKAFEMEFTTQTLLSTYDDIQLGTFAETIADECDRGEDIGACDIESIAYDESSDNFYIFSGKSSSQSAIFRLTRGDVSERFVLEDYIDLGNSEYADALFIDGEMMVASSKNLYTYDYSTNTQSAKYAFRSPDGKIHGMAYANGTLWITTSTFKLIKVNWSTKVVEAIYDMPSNGVYDPRGIEIIDNKLYILEGMNSVGSNQVLVPFGHVLKNAIHIYEIPTT